MEIYITFNTGFGGDPQNLIDYDDSFIVPNAIALDGKTFSNYTLGEFGIILAGETLSIMQIIRHYYATNTPRVSGYEILSVTADREYKYNTYTVKAFNDVGSTTFTSHTFTIDATSVDLPVKTKSGYRFDGYSLKTPTDQLL